MMTKVDGDTYHLLKTNELLCYNIHLQKFNVRVLYLSTGYFECISSSFTLFVLLYNTTDSINRGTKLFLSTEKTKLTRQLLRGKQE